MASPAVRFYPRSHISRDLCTCCDSTRAVSDALRGALSGPRTDSQMNQVGTAAERVTGRGFLKWHVCPSVPADEHVTAGEHWHAEFGAPAALHQDVPGAPRAAGLARLPQRAPTGPAHLDFQPQRHPHGPRWEGAPLHGLALAAALTASELRPFCHWDSSVLTPTDHSSVPAHSRATPGRGRGPVAPAWLSGACTHHSAGPSVHTRSFFPAGGVGWGGGLRSLGAPLSLGAPEASNWVNTVIAFAAPMAFSWSSTPALSRCLDLAVLTLGFDVMWQSELAKLFSFGSPKIYSCLPKRFRVYMVGFFPLTARKLLTPVS